MYSLTESDEYHYKTLNVHIEYDESPSYDVVQKNIDRRNILTKCLSRLHFQSKVIEFAKYFISNYNAKRIKENQQESKVLPTYRWSLYHLVTLCNILSLNSCALRLHLACKKVKYGSNNKRNFKFQVEYMSFSTFKKKAFR